MTGFHDLEPFSVRAKIAHQATQLFSRSRAPNCGRPTSRSNLQFTLHEEISSDGIERVSVVEVAARKIKNFEGNFANLFDRVFVALEG
jgi:hypothetical protein